MEKIKPARSGNPNKLLTQIIHNFLYMVYMAPLNPDSYRDNEQHVDNFADHLREKAAIEQRNIVDITTEEMHRFKDVMF